MTLESSIKELKAFSQRREDVQRLIDSEIGAIKEPGAPKGNQNASKENKNNPYNVRVESNGYGNDETYLLRRLKRDRPDLAERVA